MIGKKRGLLRLLTIFSSTIWEKIKNFIDDKEFSDADNARRIVVTGVKGEATPSEVESGVREIFPNIVHLHRCQIDEFFWGLYVLSFSTQKEANDALKHDLVENNTAMTSKLHANKRDAPAAQN